VNMPKASVSRGCLEPGKNQRPGSISAGVISVCARPPRLGRPAPLHPQLVRTAHTHLSGDTTRWSARS
jgi:hypothetical protein